MAINEISWNAELENASDLINNPALADFKDLNSLAKAFVDTKAMVGQSIRVPSADAGDEDRKKFYEALQEKVPDLIPKPDVTDEAAMSALMASLGKPNEAGEYEFPEIEGLKLPEEREAFLRDAALKSNLTKKQFKQLSEIMLSADAQSITAQKERQQEELKGLMNEWGAAFDSKYESVIKVAEKSGMPESMVTQLREKTAGVDTVKWLDGLVKAVGSEDFQIHTQPRGNGGITPAEARERASELRNKAQEMNVSDPAYSSILKKIVEMDTLARAS